jgi:hypothetical protein
LKSFEKLPARTVKKAKIERFFVNKSFFFLIIQFLKMFGQKIDGIQEVIAISGTIDTFSGVSTARLLETSRQTSKNLITVKQNASIVCIEYMEISTVNN